VLHVSLPASYRLRSARYELPREVVPGNPLVRYTLPVTASELRPDANPQPLADLDTVWLEPRLDDWYCITMADSIPEFAPAPATNPAQLANVQAFYSVEDARANVRTTGLLRVRLDPAALARPPRAHPPVYPAETREPFIPGPAMDALTPAGSRTSLCGDPQQPLELFTSTWETTAGGRLLVVYLNGAPRKQLYDLNGDSIVELEMWDGNGDGRFEARRPARFPIPDFLLPERAAEAVAAVDSLASDPTWQQLFHDTTAGPFRFVPDSMLPPALRPRPAVLDTVAPPLPIPTPGVTPSAAPDTAWLRRFNDTAAGPYRFAPNPPPRLYRPPPPPRPRRDEPLGTPIPYPRPG
jgi:hypothetical protein